MICLEFVGETQSGREWSAARIPNISGFCFIRTVVAARHNLHFLKIRETVRRHGSATHYSWLASSLSAVCTLPATENRPPPPWHAPWPKDRAFARECSPDSDYRAREEVSPQSEC